MNVSYRDCSTGRSSMPESHGVLYSENIEMREAAFAEA